MYKKMYNSPLGVLWMISDGKYLIELCFENSIVKQEIECTKRLNIFVETERWLNLYFQGKKPDFVPKYKISCTPFMESVIDIVCKIPYGKTVTYNDIAKIIAKQRKIKKMSAQAVGRAVGKNPICIIIPCHRVIGTQGKLVGYGGGIENKIELLEIEGHNINQYKKVLEEKGI